MLRLTGQRDFKGVGVGVEFSVVLGWWCGKEVERGRVGVLGGVGWWWGEKREKEEEFGLGVKEEMKR